MTLKLIDSLDKPKTAFRKELEAQRAEYGI